MKPSAPALILMIVLWLVFVATPAFSLKSNADFDGDYLATEFIDSQVHLFDVAADGAGGTVMQVLYSTLDLSGSGFGDTFPASGSYAVQSDGSLTSGIGGVTSHGILSPDNGLVAMADMNPGGISLGIKKSSGLSNAILSGAYIFVLYRDHVSHIKQFTCDGSGTYSYVDIYASDNDIGDTGSGTYTVSPDGSLTFKAGGETLKGAVSADGSLVTLIKKDVTEIIFGIKTSSGMTDQDITGEYVSAEYGGYSKVGFSSVMTYDGAGGFTVQTLYSTGYNGAVPASDAVSISGTYTMAPDGQAYALVGTQKIRGIVSPDKTVIAVVNLSDPGVSFLVKKSTGLVPATWYLDEDQDGYGNPAIFLDAASAPDGYTADGSDCDDTDPSVHPGAVDACGDGIDQDCSGKDPPCAVTWYRDQDNDGFGDANDTTVSAYLPFGYILDNTDCDDTDAGIYPGAIETPDDGIDQDCDGGDLITPIEGSILAVPASGKVPLQCTFYTLVTQGAGPFDYHYDFGDGNQVPSGKDTQFHTYTAKGIYKANVTVSNALGMKTVFSMNVSVVDDADLADFQTGLASSIDDMTQAGAADELPAILSEAAENVDKTLAGIQNADDAEKAAVQEAVQASSHALIFAAENKLSAFVADDTATSQDAAAVSLEVGELVSEMVANKVPVLAQTLDGLSGMSGNLFTVSVEAVIAPENLTPDQVDAVKSDPAASQAFFSDNVYLMDDAVDAAGITVGATTPFDVTAVDAVAGTHGLDSQQSDTLYATVEQTINASHSVSQTQDGQTGQSIADLARDIFNTHIPGKTVADTTIDPLARNILMTFSDGTALSIAVASVTVVGDNYAPGLYDLPDGSRLGVIDAYAMRFVSFPVFPFDLNAGLLKIGASPQIRQNGALSVALPVGILSLKTGWSYFGPNGFQALTTGFSVVGGSDPSAKAYSLLATFDQGTSQLLPPAIMALDPLVAALDTLLLGDYAIDTDTGVLTMGGASYKPDYLFTPLTAIDFTAVSAAGGMVYDSLAFEVVDHNKDGFPDIRYQSSDPMGFQILFAVPD